MKYLIKSIKWTKHYKKETWYKSNRSGYTNFICNAGIYTEKDKEEMKNEKTIDFVPLTQKLINKGHTQVDNELRGEKGMLVALKERYEKDIKSTNERIEMLENKKSELRELEELLED